MQEIFCLKSSSDFLNLITVCSFFQFKFYIEVNFWLRIFFIIILKFSEGWQKQTFFIISQSIVKFFSEIFEKIKRTHNAL